VAFDPAIDVSSATVIGFASGSYVSEISKIFSGNTLDITDETASIEFNSGSFVSEQVKVFNSKVFDIGQFSVDFSSDKFVVPPLQVFGIFGVPILVSALPANVGDDAVVIVIGVSVDFYADPRTGHAPLTVQFFNTSGGSIEEFYWLFGDGEVSRDSSPDHVYQRSGRYDVTLRIRIENRWYETTKHRYIIVYPGGLIVSRTSRCFSIGLLPQEGIGFSENTGDYPFPESGDNSLLIYDDDDQPHLLVLDNNDGFFYDIMQRDGPEGTGIVKQWKDKVAVDGTGGTDPLPSVSFASDIGTFEHYWLRHMVSHIFARCAASKYRGAAGYDSEGFPTGIEFLLKLFVDGELVTPSRQVSKIPITGDIHTDDAVEGHRVQLELSANMGAHAIVGRKQEYVAYDKPDGSGEMTEDDYQEEFAEPLLWFSRGNLKIDRATGEEMSSSMYARVTPCTGPDGESGSAMQFTQTITLPTDLVLTDGTLMLWHQSLSSVTIGGDSISLTQHAVSGSWILSYAKDLARTGELVITPTGTGRAFDIRVFNSEISDDAIAYYYDNIVNHEGDVVLP
jgi:hypothetical protein